MPWRQRDDGRYVRRAPRCLPHRLNWPGPGEPPPASGFELRCAACDTAWVLTGNGWRLLPSGALVL